MRVGDHAYVHVRVYDHVRASRRVQLVPNHVSRQSSVSSYNHVSRTSGEGSLHQAL